MKCLFWPAQEEGDEELEQAVCEVVATDEQEAFEGGYAVGEKAEVYMGPFSDDYDNGMGFW